MCQLPPSFNAFRLQSHSKGIPSPQQPPHLRGIIFTSTSFNVVTQWIKADTLNILSGHSSVIRVFWMFCDHIPNLRVNCSIRGYFFLQILHSQIHRCYYCLHKYEPNEYGCHKLYRFCMSSGWQIIYKTGSYIQLCLVIGGQHHEWLCSSYSLLVNQLKVLWFWFRHWNCSLQTRLILIHCIKILFQIDMIIQSVSLVNVTNRERS